VNDLGNAFTFPFKDPSWVSKFLIAAVFMLLCLFVIGFFILAGYFIQVTQRVMRREENALPEWDDIGVKLVVGFKYCVVHFVYILPIILLYIPFIIVLILGELVDPGEMGGSLAGVSFVFFALLVLVVVPYGFALTAVSPIIAYRFALHESISEALDVGSVIRSFRRNWQNTAIVALIAVGIQSFAGIGIIVFLLGVFFTIFYAYLVSAYMYGTLYLQSTQESAA
jgi:hypothetical protein